MGAYHSGGGGGGGGGSVVRLQLALASAVCVVGRHFATWQHPQQLLPLEGSKIACPATLASHYSRGKKSKEGLL